MDSIKPADGDREAIGPLTRRSLLSACIGALAMPAVACGRGRRSWAANYAGGEQDGKVAKGTLPTPQDFDSRCGSPTFDATEAIQRAIDANGGGVFFPAVDGYYRISSGLRLLSNSKYIGEGQKSYIRNVSNSSNFWDRTVLFAGGYFGYSDPGSALKEKAYPIFPADAGAYSVRLSTEAPPGDATPGKIIFLTSGEVFGSRYEKSAMTNEIASVAGNRIALKYPLDADLRQGGKAPPLLRVQSDNLIQPYVRGLAAQMLRNAVVQNLRIETSMSRGQCLHVSSYECQFDNLWIEGNVGVGANPCSHTNFSNLNIVFVSKGFELAYLHNLVDLRNISIRRLRPPVPPDASTFALKVSETGQNVSIEDIHISDFDWKGASHNAALGILTPHTTVDGGSIDGSPGYGIAIVGNGRGDGAVVKNMTIKDQPKSGIVVQASNCVIRDNSIDDKMGTVQGILVKKMAKGNQIYSNSTGLVK